MIDTIVTAVVETVDPLSFVLGLTVGVLADEAGREMLRRMANKRLNQVLGAPCQCDGCDECYCNGGQ